MAPAVWRARVYTEIMIEMEYPFLLFGLLFSAFIGIASILIGAYLKIWTPRRIFLASILSFIPAMIGAMLSMWVEEKYLLVAPLELIVVAIALLVAISNYGYAKREPWKSRLHIDNHNQENSR